MTQPVLSAEAHRSGETRRSCSAPLFRRLLSRTFPRALTLVICATTLAQPPTQPPAQPPAQPPTQPLPANYRTILDNPDLLVMRVRYGPHEVVPMHDHSAYPTVFVYLNDSGVIRIDHAPPASFSVKRPPTHTGAFRVAPGTTERHSITNLSDIPSEFLRVELKRIPPSDIDQPFRGPAPSPSSSDLRTAGLHTPGPQTVYRNPGLRIDRIVCPPAAACTLPPTAARSLLVAITPLREHSAHGETSLRSGDVLWSSTPAPLPATLSPGAQALRITLLYPEESAPAAPR